MLSQEPKRSSIKGFEVGDGILSINYRQFADDSILSSWNKDMLTSPKKLWALA